MREREQLKLWTVYDRPKDYGFVFTQCTVWINAGLTIFLILLIAIKIRRLVAALIAIFSSSF
jgi:hypothetical protein